MTWYITKNDGIWNITKNPAFDAPIYGQFETKEDALNYFYDNVA